MKTVCCCLLVGMFSSPLFAESKDLRFLNNFDAKIKSLENYTVTYVEAGQKRRAPASQDARNLSVRLMPVKKKS